jgi:hypothetical protein
MREGLSVVEGMQFEEDIATITREPVNINARFSPHWNPYTITDGAAGHFRQRFIEKHGLKGWPFED